MIKNIFVCLMFCVFLFSCGKERSIHVKAINPLTGDFYGNLRVVVSSSKTGVNGEVVKTVYDGSLDREEGLNTA